MVTIEFNGINFEFSRASGKGDWYPLSQFNQLPAYCAVSVQFGTELTDAAREQNVKESHNFARNITPPKEDKTTRGSYRRTRTNRTNRTKKIKVVFNPLLGL